MHAIAINAVDNALCRLYVDNNSTIETFNHPLPPTTYDELSFVLFAYNFCRLNDWMATGIVEFNLVFNLLFGMAFLASGFVVFVVNERECKAKHLQVYDDVSM